MESILSWFLYLLPLLYCPALQKTEPRGISAVSQLGEQDRDLPSFSPACTPPALCCRLSASHWQSHPGLGEPLPHPVLLQATMEGDGTLCTLSHSGRVFPHGDLTGSPRLLGEGSHCCTASCLHGATQPGGAQGLITHPWSREGLSAPRQLMALHGTESSMRTAGENPGRGHPGKLCRHHLGMVLLQVTVLLQPPGRCLPGQVSPRATACPGPAGAGAGEEPPAPQARRCLRRLPSPQAR